jgi:hypothetical protein
MRHLLMEVALTVNDARRECMVAEAPKYQVHFFRSKIARANPI